MNQIVNFQKTHGLMPDGIIGKNTLTKMKEVFKISKNEHLAHFLGQLAHETQGFKRKSENLYYSSASRIVRVFKSDFDRNKNRIIDAGELAHAERLTKNPEALANFVYQNQNGNGDESTGDGYKFRGRSAIQLTGRYNYQIFSDYIGEDCVSNPDLVADKYYFESAVFFFHIRGIWKRCDAVNDDSIEVVTQKINGGLHGYHDRKSRTYSFLVMLKKHFPCDHKNQYKKVIRSAAGVETTVIVCADCGEHLSKPKTEV